MEQKQLEKLLESMSLEEKINQLFQAHASFYEDGTLATGPMTEQGFSEKTVTEAGSVLGIMGAESIRRIQTQHMERHPHHIPLVFMADIINGYKTVLPIPLAQGAAFDPELAKEGAKVAAAEAAAAGLHVTFSPMADLVRDARWGRVMESTGEDPYLNSAYAKAMVEGYQGHDPGEKGRIGACVKHFAAYGAPVAGREYNNVELSQRTLREDYLPAYRAAVEAGAALVMTSFNTLNRIPATADKWLMRDILRGEMGFDGVLISDWAAIEEIMTHNLAEDRREAAKLAFLAGTDMDMMTTCYVNHLKDLILSGEVDGSLLDEAVLRILELKNKLGLFENPYKDADVEEEKRLLLCEKHRETARKMASESFVLLENKGLLPLAREERVAFVGPYVEARSVGGSWAVFGEEEDVVNIREGVQAKGISAVFEPGCEILGAGEKMPGFAGIVGNSLTQKELENMQKRAIEAASSADKAVVCIGEHMAHTGEGGSRSELTIPEGQMELLRRVAAVNPNVIAVIYCGRPLDLRKVREIAGAVLVVWMPGTEGGSAIADVLYADAEPGGRLPMSFPYCVGQVPVYYAQFRTGRFYDGSQPDNRFQSRYLDIPNEPLYPFGYGLSYTTFVCSEPMLDRNVLEKEGTICAGVRVRNTGNRAGSTVIQMYIRDDKGSVVRPVRELKGFQKIWLKPGEERAVTFSITKELLRFYDINMDYVAEPGSFTVYIGEDSATQNSAKFYLR